MMNLRERKSLKGRVAPIALGLAMIATTLGVAAPAQVDAATPKLKAKTIYVAPKKTAKVTVKNKKGAKITFKSSKKKVAKVSSKGKVTGVKAGTATVTVKVVKKSKTTKLKCKVVVVKPAKKVTILDASKKAITFASLNVGKTLQLSTKLSPAKSNDRITWSTSKKSVATVTKAGKVTGKSAGAAVITAKALSGKKATVKVTVSLAAMTSSLKDAYANDFKIGAALNVEQFANPAMCCLIQSQFNSMTMENAMKPESLLDLTASKKKGSETEVGINEEVLEKCLSTAQTYGMKLRGHTLVWHSQTPLWFFKTGYNASGSYVSKEVMTQRMESYISQVLTYCQTKHPGVVYAWDVVNEAMSDSTGDALGCRTSNESNWAKVYGDSSYIDKAFEFAAKYRAEGVKLFYNDYNEYSPSRVTHIYDLVKKLFDKGVLDGVGMQSHYTMDYPSVDLVKTAILKYASISPNLEIQLTELDIHNTSNTTSGNKALADKYGSLFKMLLSLDRSKQANITGVTVWGLYDGVSWLTNFRREKSYPLLFNDSLLPKAAYTSVLQAASAN